MERERDEYKRKWSSWEEGDPEGVFAHMDAYKRRAEAAEAKVAELTEALRKAENGNFEQCLANYRKVRRAALASIDKEGE